MPVIQLRGDKKLIVDETDYDTAKCYNWILFKCDNGKFYPKTRIEGKYVSFSKVIFSLKEDQRIFCKNGDSLDMRRDNVLFCNKKEYYYLISQVKKSSMSQYYGVQYSSNQKKWIVQISAGDKHRNIKRFNLEEEAAVVADYCALNNYGQLAKLNFPELSYEQLEASYYEIMNKYDKCVNDTDENRNKTVIKLSGNYQILIDEKDYDIAKSYKWRRSKSSGKFYAQTKIDGKLVSFAKVVFSLQDNQMLLHKNGDSLDFRRENIVICNRREFAYLISNNNISTSSKYNGVQYHTATKKWRVQMLIDGQQRTLTGYDIEEDAAVVADYYALKNYRKLAKLNFPELSYEELEAKFQEVTHKYGKSKSDKLTKRFQGKQKKFSWVKSSKYVGVSWDKDENYWSVNIGYKNRRYKIRNFKSEIEAAMAYDEMALKLYGKNARVNFELNELK